MTMAVIGVVFGLYSVNQYVGAGALPFGPTLLGVMLISLGVVFVLVGLILNAISTMVDAKDSNRVS